MVVVALLPIQLGGSTATVIARGSSMEPAYTDGDLVVVRRTGSYDVGDVVAYRDAVLDRVVLHRVIGTDGGRLTLQGDNNTWVDEFRPTPDQVIGRSIMTIPAVGTFIGRAGPFMPVIVILAVIAMAAFSTRGPRGRRGREGARSSGERLPSDTARTAALSIGALSVLALSIALRAPATSLRTVDVSLAHQGAITVALPDPDPRIYPDGEVGVTDPIFVARSPRATFMLSYQLDGPATSVAGAASLVATVSDHTGWTTDVLLIPERTFEGPTVRARGRLNLRALWRGLERVQRATGMVHDSYLVEINARVSARGGVDAGAFEDEATGVLSYRLSRRALVPAEPEQTGTVGGPFAVPVHLVERGVIQLGPVSAPVVPVRIAGLLGLAVAIALLLRRTDPETGAIPAAIQRRAVRGRVTDQPAAQVVTVQDPSDLIDIADGIGAPIIHCPGRTHDRFWIVDGDVRYLFDTAGLVEPHEVERRVRIPG